MQTLLASLGIPDDAVLVRVVAPFRFQADLTLGEVITPPTGGLRIITRSTGEECTIGFPTQKVRYTGTQPGWVYDSRRQFVTADHCFNFQFGTGDPVVQAATWDLSYQIGTVDRRPQWNSTWNGGCPGIGCSYADAALVTYNASRDRAMGVIFRTTGVNNGSTVISPFEPYFVIQDSSFYDYLLQGAIVNKVGQRSGWTSATVNQACFNYPAYWPGYYLLCQWSYSGGTNLGGDSGAPLFQQLVNGRIRIVGIHWGGNSGGGAFSIYNSVKVELTDVDRPTICGNIGNCWLGLNVSGPFRGSEPPRAMVGVEMAAGMTASFARIRCRRVAGGIS